MSKIRVTRILVYEGDEHDIRDNLNRTWLREGTTKKLLHYSIKERSRIEIPIISLAEEAWKIHSADYTSAKMAFIAGYEVAEKLQTVCKEGAL